MKNAIKKYEKLQFEVESVKKSFHFHSLHYFTPPFSYRHSCLAFNTTHIKLYEAKKMCEILAIF